jgi:hypothetical protein
MPVTSINLLTPFLTGPAEEEVKKASKQEDQLVTKEGPKKIKPRYVAQQTLQYKTFIKRTMVEALLDGFSTYKDKTLAKTKIDINYTTDRADFPCIVVKFYEQTIKNAGVGHIEWLADPENENQFIPYHHHMYKGDVSLEIYGLSSVDRDKVTDAIVEIVAMGEVGIRGKNFQERIYESIGESPYSEWHFISVNTDLVSGYGETQMIAPWIPEDTFVYQCEYRVPIWGEFYSFTPKQETGSTGYVEEVDIYPWNSVDPNDTPPEDFPKEEVPQEDYIKIKKKP